MQTFTLSISEDGKKLNGKIDSHPVEFEVGMRISVHQVECRGDAMQTLTSPSSHPCIRSLSSSLSLSLRSCQLIDTSDPNKALEQLLGF